MICEYISYNFHAIIPEYNQHKILCYSHFLQYFYMRRYIEASTYLHTQYKLHLTPKTIKKQYKIPT